jgi:hypothetical protein
MSMWTSSALALPDRMIQPEDIVPLSGGRCAIAMGSTLSF